MWLDNTSGGEFEVPIGAVVEFSDMGQIKLIDDEGEVRASHEIVGPLKLVPPPSYSRDDA